jgi:rhodanese-related sulfurtransferase
MDLNWKMGVIGEALPGARRALFARYHLGGCQSCAFDDGETLAELCTRAELDAAEVLAHLLASHEHDQTMLMEPIQVAARRDEVLFVDVRTREEFEAVNIEGAEFFTQELQEKLFKQKPGGLVVLYDHTGKYVLDQVAWFRGHGLENAFGMTGGIDAWSREVDAKVMRYRVEI